MKRIGLLTSGGDCQSLNAALRGVAMSLYREYDEIQLIGILEGYKGLIYGNYKKLEESDFLDILTVGGTILGTSRQPFKKMDVIEEDGIDKIQAMVDHYKEWELDALVILGGNGTHKTANRLKQNGLNIVTLPKTIDNDIWGTEVTFGFYSAVDRATEAIDCIHTTAVSHRRVFIVELMGHKVGWLTLYAGIAGGADVILIPEIPYDINAVVRAMEEKRKKGQNDFIIAVAEGAISIEDATLPKKKYKEVKKSWQYPSISYKIGKEIEMITGQEVRVMVPGHMQRGGSPNAYDRILSTRLGAKAAHLIINNQFGYMVGVENNQFILVPLEEVAGKLKFVEKDGPVVKEARLLGISLGEEQNLS